MYPYALSPPAPPNGPPEQRNLPVSGQKLRLSLYLVMWARVAPDTESAQI